MPTRKQVELLNHLDGRIGRDGGAPTYTEMKEALGQSFRPPRAK